jgi:hypothetical protein
VAHSKDDIVKEFQSCRLETLFCLEPHFGVPERPIFERAGKTRAFEELSKTPALLVCHFARQ